MPSLKRHKYFHHLQISTSTIENRLARSFSFFLLIRFQPSNIIKLLTSHIIERPEARSRKKALRSFAISQKKENLLPKQPYYSSAFLFFQATTSTSNFSNFSQKAPKSSSHIFSSPFVGGKIFFRVPGKNKTTTKIYI